MWPNGYYLLVGLMVGLLILMLSQFTTWWILKLVGQMISSDIPPHPMVQSGQMEEYFTKLDFPENVRGPISLPQRYTTFRKIPDSSWQTKKNTSSNLGRMMLPYLDYLNWGSFLWNKNIPRFLFQILEGWSALEALYFLMCWRQTTQGCYYRIRLRLSNISTNKNGSTACVR